MCDQRADLPYNKQNEDVPMDKDFHFIFKKWRTYLFRLQTVRPDAFQEVAQAGNHRIVFDARNGHLAVAQLKGLAAHLSDEQALRLRLALLQRHAPLSRVSRLKRYLRYLEMPYYLEELFHKLPIALGNDCWTRC